MRRANIQNYKNFITAQKDILGGKPVIKGTRVPVALIVDEIANGTPVDEIVKEYELTRDQVMATLQYAASAIKDEVVLT